MFDLGYRFNQKMLEEKVSGYKKLTPYSRHCLRDILDLIWNSSNLCVDDDEILISYMGTTKKEWNKLKKEILGVNNSFVSLVDDVWYSKWLQDQKKFIEKNQSSTENVDFQNYMEQFKAFLNDFKEENVSKEHSSTKLKEMKLSSGSYFERSMDIDKRIMKKFIQDGEKNE